MIFILTTQKEEIIKEKFKEIPVNYKFLDLDALKDEFFTANGPIKEEFENILLNQYVMKKIKNGIKNFKNTYFFYRIDEVNYNIISNIKTFIYKNHSHKIKKFTILEEKNNIRKYFFTAFDEVFEIDLECSE